MNKKKLDRLTKDMIKRDENQLSGYATKQTYAKTTRREHPQCRSEFARDRDRIIYSDAFRRLSGKTQVVYFSGRFNEHITTRSIHTMYVSKIALTIGKILRLNLDLIDAIGMGHDVGHPPFGHDGEVFLSKLCRENNIGEFHHNIHSLHTLEKISLRSEGLELSLQVKDGIISHDGERDEKRIIPDRSKTEEDIIDYISRKSRGEKIKDFRPMTLEGCVVRVSDMIAYLGQDLEDGVRLQIIKPNQIPESIINVLGGKNRYIVNKLVLDIIENSYDKDYISFSKKIFNAWVELKKFNYQNIYNSPELKDQKEKIGQAFRILFNRFLKDLKNNNTNSKIFKHFLNRRKTYRTRYNDAEVVRDFIATMTDGYFRSIVEETTIPEHPSY